MYTNKFGKKPFIENVVQPWVIDSQRLKRSLKEWPIEVPGNCEERLMNVSKFHSAVFHYY